MQVTRLLAAVAVGAIAVAACSSGLSAPRAPTAAPTNASSSVWSGTLTYHWEMQTAAGGDRVEQTYDANVDLTSTENEFGVWILSGDAEILAKRSITHSGDACVVLFTDEAIARAGTADESGALTPRVAIYDGTLAFASDGRYELNLALPDVIGVEVSTREYSCGGTNETDTHDWQAGAGGRLFGSGSQTDPNTISGTSTGPSAGGTVTWNLTRGP